MTQTSGTGGRAGVLRGPRLIARLVWRLDGWRSTAIAAVLTVETFSPLAYGVAIRRLVDDSLGGHTRAALAAAVIGAVTFALIAVGSQVRVNLIQQVNEKVGLAVDEEVMTLVAGAPAPLMENPEYLDQVEQARRQGVWAVDCFWSSLSSLQQALRLAVLAVLLMRVEPLLLIVCLLAAVPVLLKQLGDRGVRAAVQRTSETARVEQHLFDLQTTPGPAKELRVSGSRPVVTAMARDLRAEITQERFRQELRASILTLAGWILFLAGYAGCLAVISARVLHGERSLGDLLMVVTLGAQLQAQVAGLLTVLGLAQHGRHSLRAYLWLRDVARRTARAGGTAPPARLRQGVRLEGVSYTYPGRQEPAIGPLDLRLPAGALVAVVGEHGSGKTTLVKLLTGLCPPTTGIITVDGSDLAGLDPIAWHSRTSAAFQDFVQYELQLREAVGVADLPAVSDDERLLRAAEDADASVLLDRLPEGLDAVLGRRFGGHELSTGQWQKTALARACLPEDPLLAVLDEPTASLDALSEHAVYTRYMRVARRLAEHAGTVTILISHQFSTLTMADLIIVLENGKVTATGTHRDLLAAGGTYATLHRLHLSGFGLQAQPVPPRQSIPGA